MIRAIMSGCNGKMGQVITGICKEDAEIEIVAGIDLYDGIKNDYPVFPNISVCDVAADVIIDFSNAKAVDDLLADPGRTLHDRTLRGAVKKGGRGIEKSCRIKICQHVAWNQYVNGTVKTGCNHFSTGRF